MSEVNEIKDGDVFRWCYKKPGDYLTYWATSQIAIARGGVLADTYWSDASSGRYWSLAEAMADLELIHLGNLVDYDKRDEWCKDYYDDADCLNLNHSNSPRGNFYVRKGAARSKAKMLAALENTIKETQRQIDSATYKQSKCHETIERIKSGQDLDGLYV